MAGLCRIAGPVPGRGARFALFLFIPVFLAIGPPESGMLDSMGRTLLGVLLFVFCMAHLALLSHHELTGVLELFGSPGVGGRTAPAPGRAFPLGHGLVDPAYRGHSDQSVSGHRSLAGTWDRGAVSTPVTPDVPGSLVFVAVTMGALVNDAVSKDLASDVAVGTAADAGRCSTGMVPAAYAAPVFFHYLVHFAP